MIPVRAIRLRRAFGGETAVDGVDLDVAAGEIHAVVGLNGAGKTTLMRLLLGMVRPDGGRCEILGVDVGSAGSEVWGRVGHMIETPFAYPELTVTENVVAAGRLHGMNTGEARAAGGLVIERFELGRWAGRRAKVLSLGNRQRLGLACSLIHAPDVIVLDEPSNSLDPAGVVFIRDLLLDSAEQSGCAVLVSSHHLDELARISRRISVLHRGRLVGAIDPDGIDIERRFFGLVHDAEARHNSEALHG